MPITANVAELDHDTCSGPAQFIPKLKRLAAVCLMGASLTACIGDDSAGPGPDNSVTSRSTQTISIPQEEVIENDLVDGISGNYYNPPAEYPKSVTLPLEFITTVGGKKLGARVTLPADENGNPLPGPFPVIVTQSAYNTNLLSSMLSFAPGNLLLGVSDAFIVRRGYAQVAVDARGTGISEGGWELLGEDEQVGFADAVEWAKIQPWSNGKLGVAGVSYMAISSLFAAQRVPDSVDAVFASLPMGDAMRGTVGIGGMLNGLFMSTWMRLTHFTATQNVPTALLNPQHMNQIIAATDEHVDQIDRYYLPLINNALDGEPTYNYDGEFWQLRSPITNMHKVKAPTFILGALHDLFQRDEPLLYEILQQNNVDSRLVIYDGSHFVNFVATHLGNKTVPPVDLLLLQWFDRHLKGVDTKIDEMPEVVQFVKNYPTPSTPEAFRDDSYSTTTTWPHPLAKPERWYLREDGGLSKTAPTSEETGPTMENPEHPVGGVYNANGLLGFDVQLNDGTLCSRSFDQWTLGLNLPSACFSNSETSEQVRVIFESEPMTEDYYINGPILADVWMDSTVTEAVVAVQVEEVSDAQSLPITNGQLLASARAVDMSRSRFIEGVMVQPHHYFSEATSEPLVPGEPTLMQVEIFSTSAIIRKGNKLRIAISPSNQAQAMLNYPRQALAEGGVTTIHISPEHPSSVVLPIVPTSALN